MRLPPSVLVRVLPAVALFALAACGGAAGRGGSLPPSGGPLLPLTLTIDVPAKTSSAASRSPRYISPATQSAIIDVHPQGSSSSVSGYPQTVSFTANSSGCTSSLASTQCTLVVGLPPGNYDITLTTYDGPNGTGAKLSAAQTVPATVVFAQNNTVAMTLGGIPVSVRFVSDNPTTMPGDSANGFTLATGANSNVTVLGVDADGNYILGAGAPAVSLTSSDASITVTPAGSAAPNRFLLSDVAANGGAGGALLRATVTPAASSGASAISATAAVMSRTPTLFVEEAGSNIVEGYSEAGTLTVPGFASSSGPAAGAFDWQNGWLYVANASSNTVTAFNLSGVPQTLPAGSFLGLNLPEAMIFDPDNGLLYVANENAPYTITAYDRNGVLQTLTGTFPNLNRPHAIAYDPVNKLLYVANAGAGITVYDANGTQQLTSGTFPNVSSPTGIAYDVANGYLYVANFNNGTMTVYDQNGNQRAANGTFSIPPHSIGVAYDFRNDRIYVTAPSIGGVYIYDPNGNNTGSFPVSQAQGITFVP